MCEASSLKNFKPLYLREVIQTKNYPQLSSKLKFGIFFKMINRISIRKMGFEFCLPSKNSF